MISREVIVESVGFNQVRQRIRPFNVGDFHSHKNTTSINYTPTLTSNTLPYDFKVSSSPQANIPRHVSSSSLWCVILEVSLYLLHFSDIENTTAMDLIMEGGARVAELLTPQLNNMFNMMKKCPRYSQIGNVWGLNSVITMSERRMGSLRDFLKKMKEASLSKTLVAVLGRIALFEESVMWNEDKREGVLVIAFSHNKGLLFYIDVDENQANQEVFYEGSPLLTLTDSWLGEFSPSKSKHQTVVPNNTQININDGKTFCIKWVEDVEKRMGDFIEKIFHKQRIREEEKANREILRKKVERRKLMVSGVPLKEENESNNINAANEVDLVWVTNVISLQGESLYKTPFQDNVSLTLEEKNYCFQGMGDGLLIGTSGSKSGNSDRENIELKRELALLKKELLDKKKSYEEEVSSLQGKLQQTENSLQQWMEGEDEQKYLGFVSRYHSPSKSDDFIQSKLSLDYHIAERGRIEDEKTSEEKKRIKAISKSAILSANLMSKKRAEAELFSSIHTQQSNLLLLSPSKDTRFNNITNNNNNNNSHTKAKQTTRESDNNNNNSNLLRSRGNWSEEPTFCHCCNRTQPARLIFMLSSCGHYACLECLSKHLTLFLKVPLPIPCPYQKSLMRVNGSKNNSCTVSISYQDIEKILGRKAKPCPKCFSWCIKDESTSNSMLCACGVSFCGGCNVIGPCNVCIL